MAKKKPSNTDSSEQSDFTTGKYWRQTVFVNGKNCTGLVLKQDFDAFMANAPEDVDLDYWFSDTDERLALEKLAKKQTITTP